MNIILIDEAFWGSLKKTRELMLKVDNIIPMWRVVIRNMVFTNVEQRVCFVRGLQRKELGLD